GEAAVSLKYLLPLPAIGSAYGEAWSWNLRARNQKVRTKRSTNRYHSGCASVKRATPNGQRSNGRKLVEPCYAKPPGMSYIESCVVLIRCCADRNEAESAAPLSFLCGLLFN